LLGEANVGKTTFFNCVNHQEGTTSPTVNPASAEVVATNEKDQKIAITFWDTAGQERYRELVGMYAKNVEGVFILYDVTLQETFDAVADYWIDYIAGEHPHIIVFANKTDLPDHQVKFEKARELAAERNVTFMEGSAKTGEGVNEAMKRMATLLPMKERPIRPPVVDIAHPVEREGAHDAGGCC
jgi:small GTP-binding protein